jgi:hypothetical protein
VRDLSTVEDVPVEFCEAGNFRLFCIDHGYYIDRLEDLVSLVVDVYRSGLLRGKFYLLAVDCNPGVPG